MKTTETLPTLADLNSTQSAWMSLAANCDQNSASVRQLLADMARAPASHLTFTTAERDRALAIIEGQPATADRVPIETAKEILRRFAKEHGQTCRLDVAWDAEAGQWEAVA